MVEFQHTHTIGKYLGFPLLSERVKNSDFSYIIDRINSRLAGWKGKLLSRAGRVTLAKFVLNSMPIYTMHNLWIPKEVCDAIDSSIKQFIWGGKTYHWVKWNTVSQPRSRGGLGLRKARPVNVAMLGKHVWEILHHPDKLWVRVLIANYLSDSHIFQPQVNRGSTHTWQSILKATNTLSSGFICRVERGNIFL